MCFSFLKSAAPRPEDKSNANCSGNTNGYQVIHPGWSCWKSSLQPVIGPDMLLLETETARSPELVPVEELVCISPGVFLQGIDGWLFILYSFRACQDVVLRASWFKNKEEEHCWKAHPSNEQWLCGSRRIKLWRSLPAPGVWNTEASTARRSQEGPRHLRKKSSSPQRSGLRQDQLKKSRQTQQKTDSDGWRVRQE